MLHEGILQAREHRPHQVDVIFLFGRLHSFQNRFDASHYEPKPHTETGKQHVQAHPETPATQNMQPAQVKGEVEHQRGQPRSRCKFKTQRMWRVSCWR
jgi:hypothetical protein